MKAIITGSHGFVCPYLIDTLKKRKIEVLVFDRNQIDITNFEKIFDFIKSIKPNFFFHLATGPLTWLEYIFKACSILNVKLIYTSSVSVFSEQSSGPYTILNKPDATDDYGKYKIEGENIVNKNKNNLICRIGWQIGYEVNSNNMYDFIEKQNEQNKCIIASSKWFPSTSFVDKTCETICNLTLNNKVGLYQINQNTRYSFYEIVLFLKKKFNKNWNVIEDDKFIRDDRMIDSRCGIDYFNFEKEGNYES